MNDSSGRPSFLKLAVTVSVSGPSFLPLQFFFIRKEDWACKSTAIQPLPLKMFFRCILFQCTLSIYHCIHFTPRESLPSFWSRQTACPRYRHKIWFQQLTLFFYMTCSFIILNQQWGNSRETISFHHEVTLSTRICFLPVKSLEAEVCAGSPNHNVERKVSCFVVFRLQS